MGSGGWWNVFDFIAIPDDDLTFQPSMDPQFQPHHTVKQLNALFQVGKNHQLLLWQPALNGKNTVHDIVKVNHDCNYRYVNFVESMIPFFSRPALIKCIPSIMDRNIGIGWGIDYVWATRLISDQEPNGLAVIDKIIIIHTRPVAQNYPEGVDPQQDKARMIAKYDVKAIAEQNQTVFPPGNPYALKTLECITTPILLSTKREVVLPAGLNPGDTFEVDLPDGRKVEITVPEGAVEGSTLIYDISTPTPSPPSAEEGPPIDTNPFYVPPRQGIGDLHHRYPDVPFQLGFPQQEEFKPLDIHPAPADFDPPQPPPSRYNLRSRQVPVETSPSPSLPSFPVSWDDEGSQEGDEGPAYIPATPTPSPEEQSGDKPATAEDSKGGGIVKPQRIVLKKDFQKGLSILKSAEDKDADKKKTESMKNLKIIQ